MGLLSTSRRYYSSTPNLNDVKPVITYDNADEDKRNILADNRNKSGIYRWINKINGNTYIGSSINLAVRMYTYYSLRSLAKSNRLIDRSLLKYGFSLSREEILEYSYKNNVISREQYYINILKPNYNIVKIAGSTLGYKHTPESLAKMRDFVLSDEVIDRKALSTANATAARKITIIVENIETKVKQQYSSLTEAGYALGVSKVSISQSLINDRLIKKTYRVSKIIKT
uniref:Putative GIY-YIG homing endonuclease n=1 Tax=Pertusaria plittiana TaxID=394545 RepID=A0A2P1M534_9LECA|nr:putative GIY-YIG homing endonuclease [Pertusaria plittiana]